MARKKKSTRRRRMIPHPSITGLASGLIVGESLNAGYPFSSVEGRGVPEGTPHHYKDTVLQNLAKGDVNRAFTRLTHNAQELVTQPGGRKHLGKAIGVAVVGAGVKKFIGNPKLGFGKWYFRI